MAGEFVTRGSRRQRNSVSWPDERAAMLDRTVIDRGLGGGEEATPLPSGSGDGWLFQRNIDPVAGVIAWKKRTFRRVRDRSELCKPGRNCGPTFVT